MADQNQLAVLKKELNGPAAIAMFRDVLPNVSEEHALATARRFAKMVYTTVMQNDDLQDCSPKSLIKAASVSASLDLDIDPRGLAYLVPYNNKDKQCKEAQFQIGYQGLIELAYRSGKVKNITAHCIYESERENVKIMRIDGLFTVEHPFEWQQPTGDIIAVYATAQIEGLGPVTHVMRTSEVEQYRQRSKSPNSPAWRKDYPAMCKKTCIRQLAKFLPKSILDDFTRAAALDEQESLRESFDDASARAQADIQQDSGSEVIDAQFEQPGQQQARSTAQPAGDMPEFITRPAV